MHTLLVSLRLLPIVLVTSTLAPAALVSSGPITFSENGYNLAVTVSAPLTFTVTTARSDFRLSVTLPGVVDPAISGGFSTVYSLGSEPLLASDAFTANPVLSVADVTGGALTFYFDFSPTQALSAGDVVLLSTGVFELANYRRPQINFPIPTSPDAGIFLAGSGREVISSAAVPEPGSALLIGLGAASTLARRRRQA